MLTYFDNSFEIKKNDMCEVAEDLINYEQGLTVA